LLLAFALLAAPAGASAQSEPPSIGGTPLKIWADPTGSVQVDVDARPDFEFFAPNSFQPNAGFGVNIGGASPRSWGAFISRDLPTPTTGPTVAPGNPATSTTSWGLTNGNSERVLDVTQILSYTPGQRRFLSTYNVRNVSNTQLPVRAFVGGDLTIRGSDSGVGIARLNSSPRFVGGLNRMVGGTGVLVEQTPWSAFESGELNQVRSDIEGTGLNNKVSTQNVDNAAAVQWNDTIPAGQTRTYSVFWRFVNTLGIAPTSATKTTGSDASFEARLGDVNGHHAPAGRKIFWRVSGSNSNFAAVSSTTDDQGKATFHYVGGVPGEDEVIAFVDRNGNGFPDFDETQANSTVTWKGLQPPVQGVNVNARPLSGKVFIKLPSGASGARAAKRMGIPVRAARGKFVRLKKGDQIPVKSTVDTRRGKVRLLAIGKPTKSTGRQPFQGGTFNGGRFVVSQRSSGSGLTTLRMLGGGLSQCASSVTKSSAGDVSAARKRRHRRRLFSRAHGRFRSRGRNSSATVRGTQWNMTDTCAGTLTVVKSGTVTVRDFRRHRTITLKKGHKYLARPLKRKRRHR
jgi:hypothetical protein